MQCRASDILDHFGHLVTISSVQPQQILHKKATNLRPRERQTSRHVDCSKCFVQRKLILSKSSQGKSRVTRVRFLSLIILLHCSGPRGRQPHSASALCHSFRASPGQLAYTSHLSTLRHLKSHKPHKPLTFPAAEHKLIRWSHPTPSHLDQAHPCLPSRIPPLPVQVLPNVPKRATLSPYPVSWLPPQGQPHTPTAPATTHSRLKLHCCIPRNLT